MIEVVTAVKETLLRLGYETVLEEAEDFSVLGAVGRIGDVEEEARRKSPDVLLMDAEFRRVDRQITLRLVKQHPSLKVPVFVEQLDEECSVRALLADPDSPRFSDEALEHLDELCLTSLRSPARGCVPRTSEPGHLLHAVRAVGAGEIAKRLGIREQTVKNHLASIMQRLGVKSRLKVGIHAVHQNLASQEAQTEYGLF